MPCYKPLQAYQCSDGSVVWYESPKWDVVRSLTLPCGQCVGCRLERSRQWAVRCMHEASLYKNNCFITLTYDDDHLPENGSLRYSDFQKFMKRLRKRYSGAEPSASPESKDAYPIRFYMCGEYGENFGRPHFHACLFNFDFRDKRIWSRSPSGSRIYRSDVLEELWPFGFSSIGEVNFQSAAYVARYIMKKVTGKAAREHYDEVDYETGEILSKVPEFNKMSLKPGIGADWFKRFHNDVYPHDHVVVNGKACKPPRFYDGQLEKMFPDLYDDVKHARFLEAMLHLEDNTPDRLVVKEQVAKAKLSLLKRTLT